MQSVVAAIAIRRVDADALAGPVVGCGSSPAFPQTTIRPPPRGRLTAPDHPILTASLAAKRAPMYGCVVPARGGCVRGGTIEGEIKGPVSPLVEKIWFRILQRAKIYGKNPSRRKLEGDSL